MALFTYMKACQRFIHDAKQELVDPEDIRDYVNIARREIAYRTQSIRITPPISGQIMQINVTNGGSGYTAPVATISAPDYPSGAGPSPGGAQATAIATQIGGTLAAVNINFGGYGYFQPQVTITDPTGTGATAVVSQMTFINKLNAGQEAYNFSSIDLSQFPGVGAITAVKSVAIIYSNYRYALPCYSWSVYQAMVRQYAAGQYEYVPTFMSQYGQGAGGSLFFYPLPSQPYQMEWDCICAPSDLTTDQDYEALPAPWTDGVPYFAAHLAFLEMQNANAARMYHELYEKRTGIYSSAARPGRVTNIYGRW